MNSNFNKLLVISLALLISFASLVNAQEAPISTENTETPATLAICDHNGDGDRNLSDVGIFASCKDTFDANGDGMHDLSDISEYAVNKFRNDGWCTTTFVCEAQASTSTPSILGGSTGLGGMLNKPINNQSIEPEVLGEKIESTPKPAEEEVCTYNTPDQDVLGQTEWADGTLLRGCGPEVYVIENQQKRHILSLEDLFQYIGQRIYNVTNNILNLF